MLQGTGHSSKRIFNKLSLNIRLKRNRWFRVEQTSSRTAHISPNIITHRAINNIGINAGLTVLSKARRRIRNLKCKLISMVIMRFNSVLESSEAFYFVTSRSCTIRFHLQQYQWVLPALYPKVNRSSPQRNEESIGKSNQHLHRHLSFQPTTVCLSKGLKGVFFLEYFMYFYVFL